MVNRTRDLSRQLHARIDEPDSRLELHRWVVLYYRLCALGLRKRTELTSLGALVTEAERAQLADVTHRAPLVLAWIGRRLRREVDAGRLTDMRLALADANLTALLDALGGAERIMRTPIPFAYAQHIKIFVVLYCFSVPFAMSESLGWYTPAAASILAFSLFGIDEIWIEIEDPFGDDANDLPMDAIGQGIEKATSELVTKLSEPT